MIDLERQIRDYYETIRIPVTLDEVVGDERRVRPAGDLEPLRHPRRRSDAWRRPLVAAAAGAAAVLTVGAVLLLLPSRGGEPAPSPDAAAPEVAAVPLVDELLAGWTRLGRIEASLGAWDQMSDVATGDGILVGVGMAGYERTEAPAAWTSQDGRSWSIVFIDTGRNVGIEEVTVGGPGLVAVGHENVGCGEAGAEYVPAVSTSEDATTWTHVPCGALVSATGWSSKLWDVTAGGPGLVAVGHESAPAEGPTRGVVWTSPDGETWTRVPPDTVFDDAMAFGVVAASPGLVAFGNDDEGPAVWVSTDSFEWEKAPAPPTDSLADAIRFGPDLIGVGDGVWRSPDGLTWTKLAGIPGGYMTTVVELDGVLVAAGFIEKDRGPVITTTTVPGQDVRTDTYYDAAIWVSEDGTDWTRVPDDGTFTGIAGFPAADGRRGDYGSHIQALAVTPDGTGLAAVGDAVWVWNPPE